MYINKYLAEYVNVSKSQGDCHLLPGKWNEPDDNEVNQLLR